jgi:hypothetical protein
VTTEFSADLDLGDRFVQVDAEHLEFRELAPVERIVGAVSGTIPGIRDRSRLASEQQDQQAHQCDQAQVLSSALRHSSLHSGRNLAKLYF